MNTNCKAEFIAWYNANFASGPMDAETAWLNGHGAAWRHAWHLAKRDSASAVSLWNMLENLGYASVKCDGGGYSALHRIYNYYLEYGTLEGCIHIKGEDWEKFSIFS